LSIPYLVLQL